LLIVTLLALRILKGLLDFWNVCGPHIVFVIVIVVVVVVVVVVLLLCILFLNGTAKFFWPKNGRSVKLTTHLRLVAWYGMRGSVFPFLNVSP
jgi:hypothetical protein